VIADTEEIAAVVLKELEHLGDAGPSESELDRVRRLRRTEHAADMERTQEKADRIGMYASLLGTPERVTEELERYEGVDRGRVRDFVSRFLAPDRRVQLAYVPQTPAQITRSQYVPGALRASGDRAAQVRRARHDEP